MNVFILTDLEGIAGVADIEYMGKDPAKYATACACLEKSINLAAGAAFDAGADKVYYLDGHGGGGNADESAIDKRAIKCDIKEWQDIIQSGEIDCQIEIGAHARPGTIGGFLDHTLSSMHFFTYKVNGIEMSEYSLHALFCSSHNVPVVACIGDAAACRQAKEYNPTIYTGSVKFATERNFSTDYENADEILVNTVKEAIENYRSVQLYKLEAPYTVEVTFYRTDMCEAVIARGSAGVRRIDARTIAKTVDMIERYDDLKF